MFLTGFADEAGSSIDVQIKATKELGWKYIETRNIDGKNLSTLTDAEFDVFCEKLDNAGISINCYGSSIANWGMDPRSDEDFEKSKKLLKLTVKLGEETRTVVSGIAHAYAPEDLIGKKLAMITNLKPAKLCGIVSEGMIVCAEDENGKLAYLTPESDIADGSQIF